MQSPDSRQSASPSSITAKLTKTIIFCLLLSLFGNDQATSVTAKNEALKIRGNGDLFGDVDVIVAREGLLIKTKIGYMVWRADQPDRFCEVNPENKTFWPLTLDQWIADTRDDFPDLPKFSRVSTEIVTISGVKLNRQTAYHSEPGSKETKVVEFYTLPNFSIPGQAQKAWSKALGLEQINGFPVGAAQIMRRQHRNRSLRQVSRDKWHPEVTPLYISFITPSKTLFVVPSGYKECRDKASLLFSPGGEIKADDIEEFFIRKMK
jgi:hypothetical protein